MKASIVAGLGFGDEGKGTIVDFLASEEEKAPLVVRFSGGSQAAHNVVTEDGLHHTFSLIGSGTFRGSRTLLSRFTLVNPLNLAREAFHLSNILKQSVLPLVSIDGRAPLVTQIHIEINKARERARGIERHGSTGEGMGETEFYRLENPDSYPQIMDLLKPKVLYDKLHQLYYWGVDQVGDLPVTLEEIFEELNSGVADSLNILSPVGVNNVMRLAPSLIFEGSQGALLDEWIGFHPNTTWSTTTPDNAFELMAENEIDAAVEVIGVTRTYHTRHGDGPFPTESDCVNFSEIHNEFGEFQGGWRQGYLDLSLLEYAADQVMPTTLAVTHMDKEQTHYSPRYNSQMNFRANALKREDKVWQEEFTKRLHGAIPVIKKSNSNEELLEKIENVALAKASILSYGRETSAKKRISE